MFGKMIFVSGVAAAYLFGARAGRERYEQIMRAARALADRPETQEVAGLLQARVGKWVTAVRSPQ